MEYLTDKQKENRAYYAANAEKLKAKKRADNGIGENLDAFADFKKRKKKSKQVVAAINKSLAEEMKNDKLTESNGNADSLIKLNTRRRIEDLKMAKQLGIDVLELCG